MGLVSERTLLEFCALLSGTVRVCSQQIARAVARQPLQRRVPQRRRLPLRRGGGGLALAVHQWRAVAQLRDPVRRGGGRGGGDGAGRGQRQPTLSTQRAHCRRSATLGGVAVRFLVELITQVGMNHTGAIRTRWNHPSALPLVGHLRWAAPAAACCSTNGTSAPALAAGCPGSPRSEQRQT